MTQNDLLMRFRDAVTCGTIKDVQWGTYAGGDIHLNFLLDDGVKIEFRGEFDVKVRLNKDESHHVKTVNDNCSRLIKYQVFVDKWLEKDGEILRSGILLD